MINRGKNADQGQADHQHRRAVTQAGQNRRGTDAKEKHQHHLPPTPVITQPAGGERAGAEGNKTTQRQADQRGVIEAEGLGHAEHGSGENQHEHVINHMGSVDVTDDVSRLIHVGTLYVVVCRLC